MGRKQAKALVLSKVERAQLENWVRARSTTQALAARARIVLGAADGVARAELARRLGVSEQTISKWCRRFLALGLAGLADAKRSGAPRRIDEGAVAAVIARTLERPPGHATHWSTRLMAREMGMSQSAISRIWRGCGLQPRHHENFSLLGDPEFAPRLSDIAGVYLDPPTKVLAVGLKASSAHASQAPFVAGAIASSEGRALLRQKLGPLRATEQAAPSRRPRRTARALVQFLRAVDSRVPPDMTVQLMLNNAEVYKLPSVFRWFLKHSRFRLRFTPSGAAWRHQAEQVLALLAQAPAGSDARNSMVTFRQAIASSPDWDPRDPQPFIWVKPRSP